MIVKIYTEKIVTVIWTTWIILLKYKYKIKYKNNWHKNNNYKKIPKNE